MSQFKEPASAQGVCANPNCNNPVVVRSLRDKRRNEPSYCSRACASQARFNSRYRGSMSGPMDRPKVDKTKF